MTDCHPRYAAVIGSDQARLEDARKPLNTPVARLCSYYLDCLRHDDLGGVSPLAASNDGDPDYVELETLIEQEELNPFNSEAGRRLLARVRRDRNRQTIFLGYPVRLNLIGSRHGKGAFIAEPLLLFPFEKAANQQGHPTLTDAPPQINARALRALSNASGATLLEEAAQLAEELGLGTARHEPPDLDELLATLREVRSDWDWREEIDPYALSGGTPLSALDRQGIFNRAILVALPAEGSPYTKGLEFELRALQTVGEGTYRATSLGAWINGGIIDSPSTNQPPLLEVVALNSEQRQAVLQGLSNGLTVITGPPGTGKSQVVTSIVVNAALQGKTVLFTSKNNKAVDLVEARVNALGPRPVLVRLGADQSRLADHLAALLAATARVEDHELYREYEAVRAQFRQQSESLEAELEAIIALRNEVDHLEQGVEKIRQEIGERAFRRLGACDWERLRQEAGRFEVALEQTTKAGQPFWTRLIWPFVRNGRLERLADARTTLQRIVRETGLLITEASSATVDDLRQRGGRSVCLTQMMAVAQYFAKLAALTDARSLMELRRDQTKLTEGLVANSALLWETWLRLQPSRVGPKQRKLLSDYSAVLQMITSRDRNYPLSRDVFRRYYQLFQEITSVLCCWAVTSLSVRGRVPFVPNFFDLLVIDEASQCDIASALPLLFRARHVVVIGDPMQLRHISMLSQQQDQALLSKHGLMDDHTGWAYSARSLFDLAHSLCRREDVVVLREHHRSHADIIEFSNDAFYGGRLRIATNHERLRRPCPDEPAVRWVDVRGTTVRPASGGAINEVEAQAAVREIERLVSRGYHGSIGVVSPFRAQANRIRALVHGRQSLSACIKDVDLLADTVHKFQGDERDVMIFSPAVSSGVSDAAIGFLRRNPNLFNVAITRARAALIVVGNKEAALNCRVDYLARFAVYSGQVGHQHQPVPALTARELGPEYPAVPHPQRVSEWERLFYRALYRAGLRPIPQYPVERYVLDFALLDGRRRLAMEIDGERYHRTWDIELCRRDQIRTERLMELGWDVMRFWVYQVRDDLDHCVDCAEKWAQGSS
jgi:very-short-patch-repair endonuclease